MRKPIMVGNWKMNYPVSESCHLAFQLVKSLSSVEDVEVVICPSFTSLDPVAKLIKKTNIKLGAQNVYFEKKGAYTGEISPLMLKDLGCDYVIVGHSERRKYCQEDNPMINLKIRAAIEADLFPILCVGENLEERIRGVHEEIVYIHITGGLLSLSKKEVERVTIAYEPVWAIGTGNTATPSDAQAIHKFIRETLAKIYDQELANHVRIQYGGSVTPENISSLMAQPDIDGALVGGASLNASSFEKIVQYKG
ncbi:triose-phosphate isomerase [bacterium]|nr:triose-phosphate isomerase [bacterium]MBU2600000.1 triose-phosphate isomerase [bacterium]